MIFVDGHLWRGDLTRGNVGTSSIHLADPKFHDEDRRVELELIVNNRLDYLHIPALPNSYEGAFRFTPRNWFATSNHRNTGFVCAKYPYVAFCDDLSVPGPIWMSQVLHAAEHKYPVAGMYKKVRKLVVEDGEAKSYEEFPEGVDSRWNYGSKDGIVPWEGSIFGCSFGIPLEQALAIDGFEMACCGSGNEDSDFGIRLRRSGAKLSLNQNLFTFESEEGHFEQDLKPSARRDRKQVSRANLPVAYDAYQVPNEAEKYFSDHVLINRVINEARIVPLHPQNLRGVREKFLATGLVDIPSGPTTDWRDGSPLSSET